MMKQNRINKELTHRRSCHVITRKVIIIITVIYGLNREVQLLTIK